MQPSALPFAAVIGIFSLVISPLSLHGEDTSDARARLTKAWQREREVRCFVGYERHENPQPSARRASDTITHVLRADDGFEFSRRESRFADTREPFGPVRVVNRLGAWLIIHDVAIKLAADGDQTEFLPHALYQAAAMSHASTGDLSVRLLPLGQGADAYTAYECTIPATERNAVLAKFRQEYLQRDSLAPPEFRINTMPQRIADQLPVSVLFTVRNADSFIMQIKYRLLSGKVQSSHTRNFYAVEFPERLDESTFDIPSSARVVFARNRIELAAIVDGLFHRTR